MTEEEGGNWPGIHSLTIFPTSSLQDIDAISENIVDKMLTQFTR